MKNSATVVERARNMVEDWKVANSPAMLASLTPQQSFPSTDGEVSPRCHNLSRGWEPLR